VSKIAMWEFVLAVSTNRLLIKCLEYDPKGDIYSQ